MKKTVFMLGLLFLIYACNHGKKQNDNFNSTSDSTIQFPLLIDVSDSQLFIDSLNLGKKGANKVVVKINNLKDAANLLNVNFFKKEDFQWIESSCYSDSISDVDFCDVLVFDVNGDSYKDVLIKSLLPARVSNDVRKLFLYNPKINDFIFITNSEKYPNLNWNSRLKTIEASFFSGGFTQVFLKLQQDTLYDYAYIDVFGDSITIEERSKSGEFIVLRKNTIDKDSLSFGYLNYNPLELE